MNRSVVWLVFGLAIAAILAFLVAPMFSGQFGETNSPRLVYLLAAGLYVVGASWAVIKARPGRMIGHLLIWVGIIALLTAAFNFFSA